MAKFRFQLETVEKVRTQKEQKMLEEFSRSQRAYQEKLADKKMLMDKKQKAFEDKAALVASASINEVKLHEEYISGLNARLIRADQAIVRARRFLEQAMRHYIVARREKRMIDRLKEKALEEFKLEQNRLEQKQLDDLITMRSRLKEKSEIDVMSEEESA